MRIRNLVCFSYIAIELPSNILLKKMKPNVSSPFASVRALLTDLEEMDPAFGVLLGRCYDFVFIGAQYIRASCSCTLD
jgi:hypothetical protein